jgi:hypothetical protein
MNRGQRKPSSKERIAPETGRVTTSPLAVGDRLVLIAGNADLGPDAAGDED